MITIIDYGIGNLRSIEKAFERIGAEVLRTDDPAALAQADHLVLPGVGAFGACIGEVRQRGLERPIHEAVDRGVPFLGVCVGMQLLFEESEERGQHTGLGLLPGRVVRFAGAAMPAGAEPDAVAEADHPLLKVPHMGWNTVTPHRPSPLLTGLADGSFFYFVHSYYCAPDRPEDALASTDYGVSFPAIVAHGNVFGVQFHPEKSQQNGLQILGNFAAL